MTEVTEAAGGRAGETRDRLTIRLGAVALPVGIVVTLVSTQLHPHRADVMDNPAVFMEYAQSQSWIADHFAQWVGALLMFAGLAGVYCAIRNSSGIVLAMSRVGAAAAVQAAAAITALQAVDGVALKWAVDAWAAAPEDQKDAAFAAAQAVRWTEYSFQSFSNILLGLAVGFYGVAIARGAGYPRWLGWVAMGSGVGWTVHGVMVPYVGFFDSMPRLAGMVLLTVWAFGMSWLMWRKSGPQPVEQAARERVVVPSAAH